jgi:purine-binding chemotaxis protein CheW
MPQVATFKIGEETFGIDILLIKEIGKIPEITLVPQAPEHILGLINLRGQIVTVMDPGVFLDQKSEDVSKKQRLIILKKESDLEQLRKLNLIEGHHISKDTLAIIVDNINDVIEVDNNDISLPPANISGTKREIVSGIIQQDNQLIVLLAISEIARLCVAPQGSSEKEDEVFIS